MKNLLMTVAIICMSCGVFAQDGRKLYTKMVGDKQKYGIEDANGKPLTAAKYDWIDQEYHDGLIMAYVSELRSVDNSNNPFAAVKTGYYWAHLHGFIDMNGNEVIPCKYWDAKHFSDGVARVTNNSREWALIDKTGKVLTPFKYSEIREDWDNLGKPVRVYVMEEGNKKRYGLLSTSGRELTMALYDKINPFYEDRAIMNRNGMMGALDMRGMELTAPQYTNIDETRFVDGLCRVQKNNKWGFIDKTSAEVVPVVYDRVNLFEKDGSANVRQGTGIGRIDRTGKVLVPLKYEAVGPLVDGMYRVQLARKYGWVDQSGRVIEPIYEYASVFAGGYAYAKKDGKYGIIDKNNTIKVPFQYEDISKPSDDVPLFYFKREGKLAFFSPTFKELTPPKYSKVYFAKEGYGYNYVLVGNKWGMVDFRGNETIEPKYDTLIIREAQVLALLNDKVGLLTPNGTEIVQVKYDNLYGFNEGFCPVLLNNKMGYVNREGKEVIPLQFDEVGHFVNGKAQVRKGNETYFIDKTGKKVN